MYRHILLAAFLFALVAGLSSPAKAATVTARLTGFPQYKYFEFTLNGAAQGDYAGQIMWTRTGGDKIGNPTGDFGTFCIEITQNVSIGGQYTFNAVDPSGAPESITTNGLTGMGAAKRDMIRELWGEHYADITNADTSAAFQIAVWNIVYDGDKDLYTGPFQSKYKNASAPLFVQKAQQWLGSLDGAGNMPTLVALTANGVQDQITVEHAPLPAAAWGGIVLMGALAVRRMKKAA